MINRASSGWMRKLLLGFAVLLGLGTVAALSVQGLQNAWQNIGGHETLIQRAMTAFQITYALLGTLAVWLVWQRHPLALRAALAWAVALVAAVVLIIPAWAPEEADSWLQFLAAGAAFALVGCGGMWCLARLRRTP
jgi:cell division protein FtsW (lipid II flippase)